MEYEEGEQSMSDRDIQRLILDNARLKENQLMHCRGCAKLKRHDCGAFFYCPMLGAVDPDTDGCTKREAGM